MVDWEHIIFPQPLPFFHPKHQSTGSGSEMQSKQDSLLPTWVLGVRVWEELLQESGGFRRRGKEPLPSNQGLSQTNSIKVKILAMGLAR